VRTAVGAYLEQSYEMFALVVMNVDLQQTCRWYICVTVYINLFGISILTEEFYFILTVCYLL